ncbi:MAG: DUF6768 family protein [Phycisphaerae bacterium]
MDKEQVKKIIDNPPEYDESKEDTLRLWFKDFYSKRMCWVTVCVYVQYIVYSALGLFSAIQFFRTDQIQYQMMYAVIFLCCSNWIGFASVFGWVMMQRPRISRLEFRIAELIETIKEK